MTFDRGDIAMIKAYFDDDQEAVKIPSGSRKLDGIINLPVEAQGIVLFAHGSGSSRFSSRNQYVAKVLQDADIATLLFDLLDEHEANDRTKVFNIDLLAERLNSAAEWVRRQEDLSRLNLGYFGASTGAAAALVASTVPDSNVNAIVSRGGRPDLAGDALSQVRAPTLLIVGGDDEPVVELNRRALDQLRCKKQLKIIPGATHLFSEAGALEHVAQLASQWFKLHLEGARQLDACRK
jgi:putative phosphoribosyl transferase